MKENQNIIKGYSKNTTPDNSCEIAISAIGMSQEMIKHIEENEKLLSEVDNLKFALNNDLYKKLQLFKEELIQKTTNKKLKFLIQTSIFSFGPNNCGPNLLIVKNLPPKFSYFDKMVNVDDNTCNNNDTYSLSANTFKLKTNKQRENEKAISPNNSNKNSAKKVENQKVLKDVKKRDLKFEDEDEIVVDTKTKKEKENILTENIAFDIHSISTTLECDITNKVKDITISEFFNSIKSGFEFSLGIYQFCYFY